MVFVFVIEDIEGSYVFFPKCVVLFFSEIFLLHFFYIFQIKLDFLILELILENINTASNNGNQTISETDKFNISVFE